MQNFVRLVSIVLLLTGCSHHPYGRLCSGEVASLSGKVIGYSQAWIFDEIQRFSMTRDGVTVKSGELKTTNPKLYVPSATTQEGFMAQRLSPDRFRLIDASKDTMITWSCPVTAVVQ